MTNYSYLFRLKQANRGGGMLLFVREDTSCKKIETACNADSETCFCGNRNG